MPIIGSAGISADIQNIVVLGASGASVTAPGDANENILATITVPAGAMGRNGMIRIWSVWSYTNSVNNKTLRVRFGGIGGTQYKATIYTTSVSVYEFCSISNRNATNSQVGGNASVITAFGPAGAGATTSALDTTVAQTIVLTGQKATAGETLTLEQYFVELLPRFV